MNRFRIAVFASICLCILFFTIACSAKKDIQQQEFTGNDKSIPPTEQNSTVRPQGTQHSPPPPAEQTKTRTAESSDIIGRFTTELLDTEKNRVSNIRLAAKEINNYIVQPGETFSFNTVVGKRKAQKGYKKARILVEGEHDEGIGGGICQLSTTLFNAVQDAGLKVIERHSHSNDVHYVPRGQDAAVTFGGKDFKFKNTRTYPVRINAEVANGEVYVALSKVK